MEKIVCHLGDVPDTEYEIKANKKFNARRKQMKAKAFKELKESVKQMKESIYDKKMKNPKIAKIVKGLEEAEEGRFVGKSFTSVEEMLADIDKNRTWLDYIEIFWHRYFWNYVSEIPGYIKRFIQRGQRGWADCDTWGFDYYLGKIISEGIEHLLKYGHCAWTKKDLKALKTIQKTFKTVVEISEGDVRYIPLRDFTWTEYKRNKRIYAQMAKKYPGKYHVMTKSEVFEFEMGFLLFKDYYFHLWD
jgi:predicted transcriptional regulator